MKKPVLLLIFNSPSTTLRVFEEIRKYQPTELYISADGPRDSKEERICTDLRSKVLSSIDWQCNVFTNFVDANKGCARAVSSGINWFFENVEEGIILEDDCLPHSAFFTFCEQLLDFHKNDESVMHISGSNFLSEPINDNRTYFFSYSASIWGWATWRRAWDKYDMHLNNVNPKQFKEKVQKSIMPDYVKKHALYRFKFIKKYPFHSWDYQWVLLLFYFDGLTVHPKSSLVNNIGFDENATNTFEKPDFYRETTEMREDIFVKRRKPVLDEDFMQQMYKQMVKHSFLHSIKKSVWLFSPKLMKTIINRKSIFANLLAQLLK